MDVNDLLKDSRKKKKELLKNVNYYKEKAANEKSKKIKSTYLDSMQISYLRITRENLAIDYICSEIEKNSSFNINEIGPVIGDLITEFEGESFTYNETRYDSTYIGLITSKEGKDDYLDEQQIHSLKKYGKAIVLPIPDDFFRGIWYQIVPSGLFSGIKISFYKSDKMHRVNQTVSFGKFTYVKEFIDELILYKIKNKKTYLPPEEIEEIKFNFIKPRLDQILERYEKNRLNKLATDIENIIYLSDHDKKVSIRRLRKYK